MTLTPNAERLAVEMSLPVLTIRSVAAGIRTLNIPLACKLSNPLFVFSYVLLIRSRAASGNYTNKLNVSYNKPKALFLEI